MITRGFHLLLSLRNASEAKQQQRVAAEKEETKRPDQGTKYKDKIIFGELFLGYKEFIADSTTVCTGHAVSTCTWLIL